MYDRVGIVPHEVQPSCVRKKQTAAFAKWVWESVNNAHRNGVIIYKNTHVYKDCVWAYMHVGH